MQERIFNFSPNHSEYGGKESNDKNATKHCIERDKGVSLHLSHVEVFVLNYLMLLLRKAITASVSHFTYSPLYVVESRRQNNMVHLSVMFLLNKFINLK